MNAPSSRRLRDLAWTAVVLMAVGCVVGILVPAGSGWDFANFYDAGHRILAGQLHDLYRPDALIDGEAPQGRLRFWSTPLSAVLLAPLAALPPRTALIAFKIQNTLAYLVALTLLFLEYRRVSGGSDRERALFAALFAWSALLFQPFWTIFRVGGQTTPTVLLLLVLAMLAHTRRRDGTASALLVAAAAIKPAFAPVLVLLAVLTGPPMIAWAAAWIAIAAVLSVALLGWPIHAEFLQLLRNTGANLSAPWFYNSAPMVLTANRELLGNPGPEWPYRVLGWCIRLGVVISVGWMLVKARRQQWPAAAKRHFHFVTAVLACLLIAGIAWEHYLAALFLLLAFLVAQRAELGRAARGLLISVFAVSLAQNLILVNFVRSRLTFDGHLELLGVSLIKCAPLWLTMILLLACWRDVSGVWATGNWPDRQARDASTASMTPRASTPAVGANPG